MKDVGILVVEASNLTGEVSLRYKDPGNPMVDLTFGIGKKYKNNRDAMVGLAAELKQRGYTGTLRLKGAGPRRPFGRSGK